MKISSRKLCTPLLSLLFLFGVMTGGAWADTTLSTTDSAGVSVPKSAAQTTLTGITLQIKEALPASIIDTTTTATVLKADLTNKAKITAATVVFGGGFTAAPGQGGGNTYTAIGGKTAAETVTFMKADGTVGTFTFDASGAAAAAATDFAAKLNTYAGAGTCTVAGAVVTVAAGKGAVLVSTEGGAITGAGWGISGGVLSVGIIGQSTATEGTVSIQNIGITTADSTVDDPSTTADEGEVNIKYAQAPTGYTAANTVKVASVKTSDVSLGLATANTEITTDVGKVVTIPQIKLTENFAGSLGKTDSTAKVIGVSIADATPTKLSLVTTTVTFAGGFTNNDTSAAGNTYTAIGGKTAAETVTFMKADGTVGTFTFDASGAAGAAATDFAAKLNTYAGTGTCTVAGAVVTVAAGKGAVLVSTEGGAITGAGYGVSAGVVYVGVKAQSAGAAGTITIGTFPDVIVPDSAALGDIKATVTYYINSASASKAVKVGTVASAAATAALYKAPSPLPTFYTGRAGQDPLPGTGETIRFSESVAGMVPTNSFITVALSSGKMAAPTSTQGVAGAIAFGAFALNATGNSAQATVTQSTVASYNDIDIATVDLTNVSTTGSLSVEVAGSPTITKATIKLGDIANASAATTDGQLNYALPGATLTFPTIVITETTAGALVAGGGLGLYCAQMKDAALTTTNAQVKAYKADGTDISTTILGADKITPDGTGANGVIYFTIAQASNATTGPVVLKITGLVGTVNAGAVAGGITADVGGMASNADTTPTSDEGAKATKGSITIGYVSSQTSPSVTTKGFTVGSAGGDKRDLSVTLTAAGNDMNKPATIYVFVIEQGQENKYLDPADKKFKTVAETSNVASSFTVTSSLGVQDLAVFTNQKLADTGLNSAGGQTIYVGYGVGFTTPWLIMSTNGTFKAAVTTKAEDFLMALQIVPTTFGIQPAQVAAVLLKGGTPPYSVVSGDTAVATVDPAQVTTDGGLFNVTGVANGTVTITATDASTPANTATLTVKVATPTSVGGETGNKPYSAALDEPLTLVLNITNSQSATPVYEYFLYGFSTSSTMFLIKDATGTVEFDWNLVPKDNVYTYDHTKTTLTFPTPYSLGGFQLGSGGSLWYAYLWTSEAITDFMTGYTSGKLLIENMVTVTAP